MERILGQRAEVLLDWRRSEEAARDYQRWFDVLAEERPVIEDLEIPAFIRKGGETAQAGEGGSGEKRPALGLRGVRRRLRAERHDRSRTEPLSEVLDRLGGGRAGAGDLRHGRGHCAWSSWR